MLRPPAGRERSVWQGAAASYRRPVQRTSAGRLAAIAVAVAVAATIATAHSAAAQDTFSIECQSATRCVAHWSYVPDAATYHIIIYAPDGTTVHAEDRASVDNLFAFNPAGVTEGTATLAAYTEQRRLISTQTATWTDETPTPTTTTTTTTPPQEPDTEPNYTDIFAAQLAQSANTTRAVKALTTELEALRDDFATAQELQWPGAQTCDPDLHTCSGGSPISGTNALLAAITALQIATFARAWHPLRNWDAKP